MLTFWTRCHNSPCSIKRIKGHELNDFQGNTYDQARTKKRNDIRGNIIIRKQKTSTDNE